MEKEFDPAEINNRIPDQEEAPETVDAELQRFLAEHNPVNAGANALIFKVEQDEIPPSLHQEFLQQGMDAANAAMKVLKVYNNGKAQAEFENQKKAFMIMEQTGATEKDYAMVPTPLEWRQLKIDPQTREMLNHEGARLSQDQAEIIMMDYIEGKDLATIFYQWIVEHAPKSKEYIKQNVHPDNFTQLQSAVGEILEFYKASNKATNETEAAANRHRIQNLNSQKVYDFLKKTGFRLNPQIITQIKNTLKLFERNNFFHNDDHERNFMVTGDYSGNGEVKTFVIDFDKAAPNRDSDSLEFRVDRQLEQLLGEKAETSLHEEISKRLSSPEWIRRQAGYFAPASEEVLKNRLDSSSTSAASSESSFEDFVAVMLKLVQEGRLDSSAAKGFIDQIRERLVIPVPKKQPRIVSPNIYNKAQKYKTLFS